MRPCVCMYFPSLWACHSSFGTWPSFDWRGHVTMPQQLTWSQCESCDGQYCVSWSISIICLNVVDQLVKVTPLTQLHTDCTCDIEVRSWWSGWVLNKFINPVVSPLTLRLYGLPTIRKSNVCLPETNSEFEHLAFNGWLWHQVDDERTYRTYRSGYCRSLPRITSQRKLTFLS